MSRLFMPLVCKDKTSSSIGVFFLLQYYLSQCIITFCVRLIFFFKNAYQSKCFVAMANTLIIMYWQNSSS